MPMSINTEFNANSLLIITSQDNTFFLNYIEQFLLTKISIISFVTHKYTKLNLVTKDIIT